MQQRRQTLCIIFRAFNQECCHVKFFVPGISVFSVTAVSFLFLTAQPLFAQDGSENEVVLPAAAQSCVLPVAPDAIPAGADRDTLLAAKKEVGRFQGDVEAYRGCLSAAETDDITPGNRQAIVSSYNYAIEMEERVAERFNEALRAYNERQSEG